MGNDAFPFYFFLLDGTIGIVGYEDSPCNEESEYEEREERSDELQEQKIIGERGRIAHDDSCK